MRRDWVDISAAEIERLIAEYIHDAQGRDIMRAWLVDGMTVERLAECFVMSPRGMRYKIKRLEALIFKHL